MTIYLCKTITQDTNKQQPEFQPSIKPNAAAVLAENININ